jgi:tRNA pseudouridine55 synthase
MLCGLLNVNKPPGMTSRDVVNRIAYLVKPEKAGHAGTLDPLATGVLVVCLGSATKLIEYVQEMPKTYRASFKLGCTSPTDDTEGEIVELRDAPVPSLAAIEAVLPNFLGEIQQRPPAFSAIKVGGKRAYDMARAGQQVELAARPVTIHRLQILRFEYPELEIEIECGSGTYVRSLGRDLAAALGTGAVMTGLVRTRIGLFDLSTACELKTLSKANLAESVVPPITALPKLARMEVSEDEIQLLASGRWLPRTLPVGETIVAAIDARGQLVAIVVPRGAGECGATRNFPRPA